MAFPGPYARIYYNEAGEPLGWDNDYPEDYYRGPEDEDDRVPMLLDTCPECGDTHYDDEACEEKEDDETTGQQGSPSHEVAH